MVLDDAGINDANYFSYQELAGRASGLAGPTAPAPAGAGVLAVEPDLLDALRPQTRSRRSALASAEMLLRD